MVLENVPAEKVGSRGMELLAAWVRETGAGLLMTGGRSSYGPGGYYKSPLEPILPVSMELRQEHRKLSLAIVVALDRSGSMAMPVAGGRVKMDLANLGTAQVLELVRQLADNGLAVVLISHNMNDVFAVADRIACLYLGRMAAQVKATDVTYSQVAELITAGRSGDLGLPPAAVGVAGNGSNDADIELGEANGAQ